MSVPYVPARHNAVCPYLTVTDAQIVIDFMTATFGAETVHAMRGPNGLVMHAEMRIADSIVMVGSGMSPNLPAPGQVHCYVEDVDAVYKRALDAGATTQRPPTDMFYGDRIAMVKDKAGVIWAISTHKEDVSADELDRRMAAARPSS
jgi:PhnB protein